jgi:adenylate cyclase
MTTQDQHVGGHDRRSQIIERIEQIILGGPRKYTGAQLLARAGVDPERGARLWQALGFTEAGEARVFTDLDAKLLDDIETVRSTGLLSEHHQEAALRFMGQAMAGLADWQVEYIHHLLATEESDPLHWPVNLRILLPELEGLQEFIWRRHLAVAAGRLMASAPDDADLRTLAVGAVDLVGFTRTVRRITPSQLAELVELFHGIAGDAIADHGGRLVKTVGDAVLFVTDRPEETALIALQLLDRASSEDTLPEVRTGLALGSVLTRFGDIYGEVVDNAGRLCSHARPGRILVDRAFASALEGDPRFALRIRRPVVERGYPRLPSWGLRRSSTPESPTRRNRG